MSGASRATRSRMSSRRSSPFVNTPKEPASAQSSTHKARDSHKSTPDTWVEPELPQPAPSFVGDKLLRQGVLENMLPLGSLPTGKAKQKSKVEGNVFQSTPLRNGEESAPEEEVHTPNTVPPSSHINYTNSVSEDRRMRSVHSRSREADDDEYRPTAARRPSNFASRMSSISAPASASQIRTTLIQPDVVRDTAKELRDRNLPHVAIAIEQSFSQSQSDPNVKGIFDAILSKNPTRQQSRDFKRLIKSLVPSTGQKARRHRENRPNPHSISPTTLKTQNQNQSPLKRSGSPATRVSHTSPTNHASPDQFPSSNSVPIVDSDSIALNRGSATTMNGHGLKDHPLPPSPRHIPSPEIMPSPSPPPTPKMPELTNGAMEAGDSSTNVRALSTSSSPLSSVGDRIDDFENGSPSPPDSSAEAAPHQGRNSAKPQPKRRQTAGPSVGSSTKRAAAKASKTNGKAKIGPNLQDAETQERIARRREFLVQASQDRKRAYEEEVAITQSNIRSEPPQKRLQRSFSSDSPTVQPPNSLGASVDIDPPSASATPGPSTRSNLPHLRNGLAGKRSRDDLEDDETSVSAPGEPPITPAADEAGTSSRLATPKILPRPSKQIKKSARIIISPNKKGSTRTVQAGMPTRVGENDEASGGNGENGQENNDFCSFCKGNGTLLCCDGCPRSFHFSCCDPPINPDHPPAGNWLCQFCERPQCVEKESDNRLFSSIFATLEKKTAVPFALPGEFRDYFEGVKTGEDGEYEAVNNGRILERAKAKRPRGGYGEENEQPDNLSTHDPKGNLITCYKCEKTSEGRREIIACDYCHNHWHLDCLEPPMATAPIKRKNGNEGWRDPEREKEREKDRVGWKCPLHVDHDLARIGNTGVGYSFENKTLNEQAREGANVRLPKLRRPKQIKIVDSRLSRGHRNNGLIEIENMPDDWEFGDFYDHEENSVSYRVPERGIRQDFIDRAMRDGRQTQSPLGRRASNDLVQAQGVAPAQGPSETISTTETNVAANLAKRSFIERKTALNLAQLAESSADLNLTGDRVEGLVNTLIAEAPEDVIQLVDNPPSSPTLPAGTQSSDETTVEDEEETLRLFVKLANRRLEAIETDKAAKAAAAPPAPAENGST